MLRWLSSLLPSAGKPDVPPGSAAEQVDRLMREAYDEHARGNLTAAEALYRRILEQQPDNAEALYLRGELAARTGRQDAAMEWIGRAAALKPEVTLFHHELAALQAQTGALEEACAGYRRVLELEPGNVHALMGLASALLDLEQPAAAADAFRRLLAVEPGSIAGHVDLGAALQADGLLEDAEKCFHAALQIDPQCVQALSNLAGLHIKRGDYERAKEMAERALAVDPLFVEARLNLGVVFLKHSRLREAQQIFEDAVRSRPDLALAHYDLARVYRRAGNLERAIECYREAVRLGRGRIELLLDLGRALHEAGEVPEAIEHYRAAVARRPDMPLALLRLGYALESAGRFDEALACYDKALEAEPGNVQAHVNRATLSLLRGDFARGWEEYEWRLREPLYAPLHARFPAPHWEGSPLAGRRLLIYAEQGLGDEIMYASCFPEVIAAAGHVVIDCEPRLAPLYRRSFPQATIHAGAQNEPGDWLREAPPVELKVSLASLPFHLKRRAGTFPRHQGYLRADPARVQAWKARLDALGPGLKVGLSWRGGVPKTGRALRSLDLEQLLPVLRQPLHFVSLQYGDSRAELTKLRQMHRITVQHWPEAIDDYDETAALICALDLVISVCTSAVHLAGALGRPVWVMAPLKPEARYGLAGESMPWYPSARLFRQEGYGDWRPVVARVAAALEKSK